MFPEYGRVHSGISVRVTNLPVSDKLRDLRQMHLNALVRVSGVVTRRTGVFPQLQIIKFSCGKCSTILGIPQYIIQTHHQEDFRFFGMIFFSFLDFNKS